VPVLGHHAGAAPDEVGGKGAGLAALERLGLPVPAWIAVGASACARTLGRARPEIDRALAALEAGPGDRAALEAAEARIGAAVRAAGLDPEDAAELRDALERRLPGEAMLAVRSSAAGEDGAADSFAGQLRSFLAVPRAAVEARVLDVLASAYGARALLYRRVRALPAGVVRVAVLVQRLVPAVRAGVLFTANPATGDRGEAVIAAGLGLGEGVVSGLVQADAIHADLATGRVRRRATAAKRTRVVPAPGGGTAVEEVPPAAAEAEALSDAEVEVLVAMGRRAAEAAGAPLDLEWAIDAGGRMHLLQARPVTALERGREHVFDSANIVESYPGLTSPLTFTFVRSAYETTFLEAARAFGVPGATLERERAVFANLIALVDGRVYYDLLGWYRMYQLVPGFEGLLPAFEKALGIPRRRVAPAPPAHGAGWVRRRLVQLRVVLRMARLFLGVGRRTEAFLALLEQERAAHARSELAALEAHDLLDGIERLARRLNAPYAVTAVNDLFTFQLHALLERVLARWGVAEAASVRNALLSGVGGVESVEPARSLAGIAALVRAEPTLEALFASPRPDAQVWAALRDEPRAAVLRGAIEAHLARFGDRTLQELKLETPSLADDPALLVAMIRNALAAAVAPGAGAPLAAEAEREVRGRIGPRPVRRALLSFVLARCRDGLRRRESLRLARARALGMVRASYRALGRILARERLLDDAAEIFWLTAEEVSGAVRGHAVDPDLRALVALRRREWAGHAAREPAPRIVTHGVVLARAREDLPEAPERDPEVLGGTGCCPGRARGTAKVVRDPTSDLAVRGHVLVAPTTDPGWIFLMVSAAALVAERGNPLSHTAIIGRELGLPTVVGVKGAMRLLADGEELEVDGGSGTVRRLGATGSVRTARTPASPAAGDPRSGTARS
jgi:pyruvate,water dikinase